MNLPYTKALKLLAVPEEEMDDFMETHDVEACPPGSWKRP